MRSRFAFAVLALLAIAVLALPGSAGAARAGWVVLGTRSVTDAVDHDALPVTAARGDFKAIRIKVLDHAVQFHHVVIHFANGADQEVELRDVIPAGGESRVIDVVGADRVIRSIEFRYDSQSVRGKPARVRVFGKR